MALGFNGILDELSELSESDEELSVQNVLDAFEGQTFGPLLLAIGLIAVTPIVAIPFIPSLIAVLLLAVVGQAIAGKKHPWLPAKLRERAVTQKKIEKCINKARLWAKRIDKVIRP